MRRVSMPSLAAMFAWMGVSSIGGGRSVYLYDMLVVRKRWLEREEFLPGYAISQLLPGPTISNLAVFLGHKLRGATGAGWALLGVVLPGALTLLAMSAAYFAHGQGPYMSAVLRGMGAAVVGFVCVTVLRIGRGALGSRGGVWVGLLTFAAVGLLRLNALTVLLVGIPISVWLNRPSRAQAARPEAGR